MTAIDRSRFMGGSAAQTADFGKPNPPVVSETDPALTIALQAAGNTNYAAVAELYGYVRADRKTSKPPPPGAFDWAPQISAATIGFYGAMDGSIAVPDVQAAFANIKGPHDVVVYPDAADAFLDDTRGSFRAGPAADAWAKMTAWYEKYLKTP